MTRAVSYSCDIAPRRGPRNNERSEERRETSTWSRSVLTSECRRLIWMLT
jgi:hypothetical protein